MKHMSRLMGKPTICICENKGADQLRGNREADQRLCFHYRDSTIPPLLNSKISNFYPSSVLVQPGLCRTCSETTLLVFPRGGSYDDKNVSKMSRYMRKPTICICENKGEDQLRGHREADHRLCFRYTDSTIPLLLKSKISRA